MALFSRLNHFEWTVCSWRSSFLWVYSESKHFKCVVILDRWVLSECYLLHFNTVFALRFSLIRDRMRRNVQRESWCPVVYLKKSANKLDRWRKWIFYISEDILCILYYYYKNDYDWNKSFSKNVECYAVMSSPTMNLWSR